MRQKSPWCWIPTLYIAEGLPYFAVNVLTVMIYTQLGIAKTEMAYYTGWLYLPWVIKPFWSPFVDLIGTKRKWTILMQVLMGVCFAAIAFTLPTSHFFAATLALFWLTAFFSATHDISADGYYMMELTPHLQSAFVGVRSTFYRIASVIGQGGLVMLAGYIENRTGDITTAWRSVFFILSIFFLLISCWHFFFMPVADKDKPLPGVTAATILRDFSNTFVTFFRKPHILSALAFMLLYRLPEAMCIKLVVPFLNDTPEAGGLGLSTAEIGFANGTIGVVGLLAGGIIGGICISKGGLKKWLWPMALALTLPCVFYCFLAMTQPASFIIVNIAIFIEQFGYGFGFTAFMLYLIYFSQGESQTSHYAFCTAFMALGMMLPGMCAGWIYDRLNEWHLLGMTSPEGYVNFFWWVMICCIFTLFACKIVHIDPKFGRK
ncbi:MAG: MFS transporter [Prevotella sp.]|nr:MFS transporter [Bacteroides sp.]MCM1366086.1 MFS transporter [Prevotella sp.]MCM1436571.1 MFS transporter [Prevotella sp.]